VHRYVGFRDLSENECDVGRRLRVVRKWLRLSQGALAPLIASSRDQLNNVELGRAALRFTPAWNFCAEFDLNPLWLSHGESPLEHFVDFDTSRILDEDPFCEVMDGLREWYREWRAQQLRTPGSSYVRAASRLGDWLPHARVEERRRFVETIQKAASEFIRQPIIKSQTYFTTSTHHALVGTMALDKAAFWPRLRNRIARVVKERGMKAKLARDVGITRQAVDAWFSTSRGKPAAPSAEITLRLLEWIPVAEAQQKKRGDRVGPRPPHKPPKQRKSPYENRNSGRRKT
jgi:DNA-binding XRE family transcriptional regulator